MHKIDDGNIVSLARFKMHIAAPEAAAKDSYAVVLYDPSSQQRLDRIATTQVLIALLLIDLCMAMFAWHLIRSRILQPIQAIVDILEIPERKTSAQLIPVTTSDEIGKLGLSLNQAFKEIDRLSSARERQVAELNKVLTTCKAILYSCRAENDYGATFVSENVHSITGHTSGEFMQYSGFWKDHLHPDDAPRVLAGLTSLFERGQHSHEYRFLAKNGSYLWFLDELKLNYDSQGRPVEIAGVMIDISERKSVEGQSRESQKLEAIGQLTGGLAHDFNNLLGIVVGNLDEIGERLPQHDAQLRQQHRTALEAALRGAEVTRSLLAVARRQPLTAGNHDLNALVAEMVPLARSSAGSAVTVRSELAAGELPARIDAAGLSNVILNLVINARDAMQDRPGQHEITLRTRKEHIASGADETLTPGWYAVLEVTDNGAGMNEHIRAQAFQPFFTTKERGHGTGLGLAMVYGYATQLGGTARIQSVEGRGTTVQLFLPIHVQAGGATEVPPARTAASPAPDPATLDAPRGQRVLVVDDEQALCELACDWLASMGYQPTGVYSPAAALERLAAEPFDILFTDIVMPGDMDGMALARQAQLQHPHLRIVLTSGYAKGLSDTHDLPGQLVNKPYRKNDLVKAFLSLAGRSHESHPAS